LACIVVELRQEDFRALSKASGRVAPAVYLKLVALRAASLGGLEPPTPGRRH
jgi:hypothetical protein